MEYEIPTKETMLAGILKMYACGALDESLTLGEIKRFALDTRLEWKKV